MEIPDQDITERQRVESASSLLSAIIDSSDDAIISKDLNGVVTSWNKSATRLFGHTAEEAIGQTVAALIIPDDRQQEEPDILARLRNGERVDHFETVRRHKDGSLIDLSLTISPIRDGHGHIIGASKVARDISQRKRYEQRLLEQVHLRHRQAPGLSSWLAQLLDRAHQNVVIVALANKLLRMAWGIVTSRLAGESVAMREGAV